MAHEKVHVICENLCLEEGMTKEQIENTFVTQEVVNSLASGSPKGTYTDSAALKAANPDTGVYIATGNGHIYSWTKNSTGNPIDLGVYQSTGIADKSIIPEMTTFMEGGVGKNKFNKNRPGTMPYYIAITGGTGSINSGNQANRVVYCKIKPSTQYNISTKISDLFHVGSCSSVPALGTTLSKATNLKNSAQYKEESGRMAAPFITTANDNYLVIQCISASSTVTIDEIINDLLVEEGPVYTGYEAYKYNLTPDIKLSYEKPYSETTVIEKTINNTNIKIWVPASYSTKGINCVIGFHGNGSGNDSWTSNSYPDRNMVRQSCLNAGYIFAVAENVNSLTTWGNKQCVETYTDLVNYLKENFVIKKYGVFANSMGGIESLNFISEKRLDIACYVGTSLTYNLEQIFNNGQYADRIKTAYGVASDGSDYTEKTLYKDPSKKETSLFGSFPCYIIGATDDTAIIQSYNGFKFYEDMKRFSDCTKVEVTGGHGFDLTNYLNDLMSFFNSYLG